MSLTLDLALESTEMTEAGAWKPECDGTDVPVCSSMFQSCMSADKHDSGQGAFWAFLQLFLTLTLPGSCWNVINNAISADTCRNVLERRSEPGRFDKRGCRLCHKRLSRQRTRWSRFKRQWTSRCCMSSAIHLISSIGTRTQNLVTLPAPVSPLPRLLRFLSSMACPQAIVQGGR